MRSCARRRTMIRRATTVRYVARELWPRKRRRIAKSLSRRHRKTSATKSSRDSGVICKFLDAAVWLTTCRISPRNRSVKSFQASGERFRHRSRRSRSRLERDTGEALGRKLIGATETELTCLISSILGRYWVDSKQNWILDTWFPVAYYAELAENVL